MKQVEGYLVEATGASRPAELPGGRWVPEDGFRLATQKGQPIGGWTLRNVVEEIETADGELTTAVVLEQRDGDDVQYAAGYWLGPHAGDLFRGVLVTPDPIPCCGMRDDVALDEAVAAAGREAERISRLDWESEQQRRQDEYEGGYAHDAHARGLPRNADVMAWKASPPGGPFAGYSVLIRSERGSGGWDLWAFRSDDDQHPDFVGTYTAFNPPHEWGARVGVSRLPPAVRSTIRKIRGGTS